MERRRRSRLFQSRFPTFRILQLAWSDQALTLHIRSAGENRSAPNSERFGRLFPQSGSAPTWSF
jgi:hypothetical protein